MAEVSNEAPRTTSLDYMTALLRADPGFKQRPEAEYEMNNGRVFYDRPFDGNNIYYKGQ